MANLDIGGLSPNTVAAGRPAAPVPTTHDRGDRIAAIVFTIFIAIAAYVLVFHLGRYFWFNGDEWDFLVDRDGGDLGDLFAPHNEHLSLLPILVYRVLWNLFGLRTYVPYQVPVIALHLTTAVMLRALMRREGVNPWIATAAASIFVLFGPGEENIIWAFQIGFTGSLAFGLAQLLVADHDGPFLGGRDWVALGLGLLGLLCSGLTPFTAAAVGAVVLVRRGWRPALFQTAPLAALYATWWLVVGPDRIEDPYLRRTDVGEVLHFVVTGVIATFKDLAGGNRVVAAAYGVALVAGLVVAWQRRPHAERLRAFVLPMSLLLSGVAFLFVSGYGRWWISDEVANSSRYVHLAAAFFLPALAFAIDALVRPWRVAVALAAIVLVSGIPHNIGQFETLPPFTRQYFEGRKETISALARSPYATQAPRSTRPDLLWGTATAGWLLDALDADRLPDVRDRASIDDPTFRLRYGLAVVEDDAPGTCEVMRDPTDVSLQRGDELGVKVGPWSQPKDGWFFQQSYTIQLLEDGKPVGSPVLLHPGNGNRLRAQFDDLDIRFALAPGTEALVLCR